MNQKGFANIILVVVIVVLIGAVGYFTLNKLGITNPSKFNVSESDFDILGIEYISTIRYPSGSVELSVRTSKDNLVISAFSEDKQRCATKFEKAGTYSLKQCAGDPPQPLIVSQTNVKHNFNVCASSPWDYERRGQEVCKSIILSPSNNQINTRTPTSPSETTNWKTYSNTKYGFSIKYPNDYLIRTENQNVFIEKTGNGLYALVVIDNPSQLNASQYFEQFKQEQAQQCKTGPCASIVSSKVITINGLKGVDAVLAGEGSGDVRSVYLQAGNKVINYQYVRDNLNTEFNGNQTLYNTYLSNGDRILSTFQLVQ